MAEPPVNPSNLDYVPRRMHGRGPHLIGPAGSGLEVFPMEEWPALVEASSDYVPRHLVGGPHLVSSTVSPLQALPQDRMQPFTGFRYYIKAE